MVVVKRIKFGKLKIQKLNRIALPNSLLENLNLKISDNIEIFLDIEKQEIVIKKIKDKEKNKIKKKKRRAKKKN